MNLDKIKDLLAPAVSPDSKLKALSLFIGRVLDKFDSRIEKLEARQLQRGEKGDKGESIIGPAGRDGKDGRDGRDGKAGPKGDKGDAGAVGGRGPKGVSVVDAEVGFDKHLRITLSDGKVVDAGEIDAGTSASPEVFVAGNAWQITVSSTAPSDPQLNQLWYDIS